MSRRYMTALKVAALGSIVASLLILGLKSAENSARAQSNANQSPGNQETQAFNQEQKLAELRKKIAGQENKPAEQVFKNIQMLKGMPAGRLLRVMEMGYSRSLGVNCTHCHVVDQWEKDDKPAKPIAREMMTMVAAINNDYLKKIKNLKSENPVVNCTTCHRGQIKPELNLPDKPK